jgi:DNA-binding transcriptional MerR regulator
VATVRFLGGGGDGTRPRDEGGLRSAPKPAPKPTAFAPPKRDREQRTLEELPAIPDKIYFRIGEVAHLVGVEPHVLRYWEHEFRSIRPTKSQRGQRVYSRRDVEHLRRIRTLLYEQGFTIAGAKKALRAKGLEPREESDPALVAGHRAREALVEIRQDVEKFLEELGG